MANEVFPNKLDKIFLVRTGDTASFVLQRLPCEVFELDDVRFHHGSAVVLPDPPDDVNVPTGDHEPRPTITSLVVLAECLKHAAANPEQRLLITGHADTSGDVQYNVTLTERRGDATLALLIGDRDKFVTTAKDKHKTEDVQHILHWLARDWGWDCAPGKIDDQKGSKTDAAIKAFKHQYNAEFGRSIPEDSQIDGELWGAVFDVYAREIADLLDVDDTGLAELRQKLVFIDDGRRAVGCGESFPIDAPQKSNYRSQANRRMEIMFFDERDAPPLPCHPARSRCAPQDCRVHDPRMYAPRFIRVAPVAPKRTFTTIQIALRDRLAELIDKAPYRLEVAGKRHSGRAEGGVASIRVRGTPAHCLVEWGCAEDPDVDASSPAPCFRLELHVDYASGSDEAQARKRLHNIGYPDKYAFDVALRAFQRDMELPETGTLDDDTKQKLIDAHGTLATKTRGLEGVEDGR
jgi:hypothetical protein